MATLNIFANNVADSIKQQVTVGIQNELLKVANNPSTSTRNRRLAGRLSTSANLVETSVAGSDINITIPDDVTNIMTLLTRSEQVAEKQLENIVENAIALALQQQSQVTDVS